MTCAAHALAIKRGFLQGDDVDLIQEIANQLSQEPFVADIGTGAGTTALAVLAIRPNARIFSVDHNLAELNHAERAMENVGLKNQWIGVRRESTDIAKFFQDETFDFFMLDTSHEYEDTVKEIAVWIPKLKIQAPCWFHDYLGDYPGCRKAIDEAVVAGLISFHESRGLGWSGYRQF